LDVDEKDVVNPKIIAATQYAAMHNFRCIYRETSYHTDVRRSNTMPEWKKIERGYKYNEEELVRIFRVPRHLYLSLVKLLKKNPSFAQNGKKQSKHFSTELHPIVLLKYMGTEGNGSSAINVKQGFGIAKGTILNYLRRSVDAVLSLFSEAVFWPNKEGHKEISLQIQQTHHFPICVSALDGTHLGLAFKPELEGGEYWICKQSYAVAATLVCDDHKRIITSTLVGQVQFMIKESSKI
jgi:hypothetical protein